MSQKSRASNSKKDIENHKTPSPKDKSQKDVKSHVNTPSDKNNDSESQNGLNNNDKTPIASRSERHSRGDASGNMSKQQTVHENESIPSKRASRHRTSPEQSGGSIHSTESQRVGRPSAHPSIKTKSREDAILEKSDKSTGSRNLVSGTGGQGRVGDTSTKHTQSFAGSTAGESVINYSLLDFRALEYGRDVANARVVIHSGNEACNCYPHRSSQAIPSMIYDQIKCVHHGLVGYIHDGVCDFDDGWRGTSQQGTRKQKLQKDDTSFFRGYPQPLLERMIESQRSSMVSEEELKRLESEISFSKETIINGKSPSRDITPEQISIRGEEHVPSGKSLSENIKQGSKSKRGTSLTPNRGSEKASSRKLSVNLEAPLEGLGKALTSSQQWNMKRPTTPEKRPTSQEIRELEIPRIGYSPSQRHQPSIKSGLSNNIFEGVSKVEDRCSNINEGRSPLEDRNNVTLFTPQSYGQHEKHGFSSTPKTQAKTINKDRTFQGKYYDPVKDEVLEYEVTHQFGKHINRWPTKQVHITQ